MGRPRERPLEDAHPRAWLLLPEAADVDPATGVVYLTEDDFRGVIAPDPAADTRSSFLYRFLPNAWGRPGALARGGRLQALTIEERPAADADFFGTGQTFGVRWVDVPPEEPHEAALAAGCVRFDRLEGCHFAGGAFWFDDTAGGEARLGQLFRYLPATNTLELLYEGTDATEIESPGHTFAIWGPFARHERAAQRQLAAASPPAGLAPRLSGELAEAAARHGLSPLEAAAFDRPGVPVT